MVFITHTHVHHDVGICWKQIGYYLLSCYLLARCCKNCLMCELSQGSCTSPSSSRFYINMQNQPKLYLVWMFIWLCPEQESLSIFQYCLLCSEILGHSAAFVELTRSPVANCFPYDNLLPLEKSNAFSSQLGGGENLHERNLTLAAWWLISHCRLSEWGWWWMNV